MKGKGLTPLSPDDIHERFAFHPALSETRRNQHDAVRQMMERTALWLGGHLPNPSRELALALTSLEECMYWSNKALALAPDYDAEELIALTPIERAKRAYAAYGAVTDHKNHMGAPMPPWDELGDTIQSAWIAAANNGGTV